MRGIDYRPPELESCEVKNSMIEDKQMAEQPKIWNDERKAKLRDLISQLYRIVSALEQEFEGRRFTPDGHLVGSIGEVVAAYAFNLTLLPASNAGHDAKAEDGTFVQIKLTGGNGSVSLYSEPQHLIVLQLRFGEFVTVYNGPGAKVWQMCRLPAKNGQRTIALSQLRLLNASNGQKLQQWNDFPSCKEIKAEI